MPQLVAGNDPWLNHYSENAMIAAGSVVTKDVPDNEIWSGNPARFVRKVKG